MPVHPPAIFAIGKNYSAHAHEMGGDVPSHPVIFMKNPASVIGNREPIVIPPICETPHEQVDFEGELAVVIGCDCRDVREDDAQDVIKGYAIANDVSARWWQNSGSGGQFVRGKSFDTFCPMSELIPAEKINVPHKLRIVTKLNDELMQDDTTANMIFSINRILAELSIATTLLADTVILTGTPAGVGHGRRPPRYLREGDRVEISISGLGVLKNPVQRCGMI